MPPKNMNKKPTSTTASTNVDEIVASPTERILKSVYDIYSHKQDGLRGIAEALDLEPPCLPPRKRITVLIIGNHSAGKSSFINWYIGEHIQKVGVAIETSGVTIIHSGKKKESLRGEATLQLFEHLSPLREIPRLVDHLATEVASSKDRQFSLVDFVDTPGLVDGNLQYPFDVDKVLEALAKLADLIFVFFDPIGKSLTSRTMNVVEKLNENHAEKIRYYMTKADTVPDDGDRQKVLIQITQNLTARIKNAHAFDLPTIYIPTKAIEGNKEQGKVFNKIDDVVKDIEKTINLSVQNSLNNLGGDCRRIISRIDELERKDREQQKKNFRAFLQGLLLRIAAYIFPLLTIAYALVNALDDSTYRVCNYPQLKHVCRGVSTVKALDPDTRKYLLGGNILTFAILWLISAYVWRKTATFSKKELNMLRERRRKAQDSLKRQTELYQEYLHQSVHSEFD